MTLRTYEIKYIRNGRVYTRWPVFATTAHAAAATVGDVLGPGADTPRGVYSFYVARPGRSFRVDVREHDRPK